MEKKIPTNYKVVKWYNVKTKDFFFGIAAKVDGKWVNCRFAYRKKDNFFTDRKLANEKKKQLLSALTCPTT